MNLLTIVDFGSNEVFVKIRSYIGIFIGQKKDIEFVADVRVIRVLELPPRFVDAKLLEAESGDIENKSRYLMAYTSVHPRGSQAWLLLSPSARRAIVRLEEDAIQLPDVAVIYQGIRTGANDIFILEIESGGDGHLVQVRNGLGDVSFVEMSMLRPVIFGSEIQRYDLVQPNRYLIYPYKANTVLSEIELREEAPNLYEYLTSYKDLLASRTSIQSSGLRWYELVRKREESWLERSKLLIRDLAIKTSFALDQEGIIYLVGGTAVVPEDTQMILTLLGYLNSKVVDWFLQKITPSFRAGFQKFEPQHLQQIPIPNEILNDLSISNKLSELVTNIIEAKQTGQIDAQENIEREIDRILCDLIGINLAEIQ